MQLVKYDAARKALQEAHSIDEVKSIRDKAQALAAYARQAKDTQMIEWVTEIKVRAERRAGEMSALIPSNQGRRTSPHDAEKSKVEILSNLGITTQTASRWERLAAIPDDKFELAVAAAKEVAGQVTSAGLIRETRRTEYKENLTSVSAIKAKELTGLYDVLVIDPPWPMEKIERDVRPNQSQFDYPTMSEDELLGFVIPAASDCHLWLWTTHKFIPLAFNLLVGWNAKYVCTFVWHKPGGFQPIGLPQYNCEFALYARIGSPKFIDTKAFPVCFNAPRGAHSEKPSEFYDVVRRVTAVRDLGGRFND